MCTYSTSFSQWKLVDRFSFREGMTGTATSTPIQYMTLLLQGSWSCHHVINSPTTIIKFKRLPQFYIWKCISTQFTQYSRLGFDTQIFISEGSRLPVCSMWGNKVIYFPSPRATQARVLLYLLQFNLLGSINFRRSCRCVILKEGVWSCPITQWTVQKLYSIYQ